MGLMICDDLSCQNESQKRCIPNSIYEHNEHGEDGECEICECKIDGTSDCFADCKIYEDLDHVVIHH